MLGVVLCACLPLSDVTVLQLFCVFILPRVISTDHIDHILIIIMYLCRLRFHCTAAFMILFFVVNVWLVCMKYPPPANIHSPTHQSV